MEKRTLGKAGIDVTVLGYGAWGIGQTMWIGADDDESLRALRTAIDSGVNFIDTAYGYGDGHSERLVGEAVRASSEQVYVATKIPPKNRKWPAPDGLHPDETFPAEHVIACTEESLRRLGLERIDVQQFHVWSDEWVDKGDWLEAIEQLKRDGKIGAFGVSINDHQAANGVGLVRSGHVDTVQVIYNAFDQSPEDALFPAVQEANVGVIARVPFDEGTLTGNLTLDTTFPEGDWRQGYFNPENLRESVERADRLRPVVPPGMTMPELALRWILQEPAVSTVIPGMRKIRNVEANVATSDGAKLDPALMAELKNHRWDRAPTEWSQ